MKKILYTSADSGIPYWNITEPILRRYAERIGAELVVMPKSTRPNPQWVIFDCFNHSLSQKEPVVCVWIDCDIVFDAESAPDIFSLPEKFFVTAPDPIARVHPSWHRGHRGKGVPNMRPYPITALMKWSPRHVEKIPSFIDQNSYPKKWGDQELLAHALFETETAMAYIPQGWHAMTKHITKNTQFFHAAGRKKTPKLKRFLRIVKMRKETLTENDL